MYVRYWFEQRDSTTRPAPALSAVWHVSVKSYTAAQWGFHAHKQPEKRERMVLALRVPVVHTSRMASTPIPSLRFEREAWRDGAHWVAGVDEVGCGPLAGPVAAAVVALPAGRSFAWYARVRDSKVLSEPTRDALAPRIRASVPYAIGWASHEEIDRIGILSARRLCMLRAFEQLSVKPDAIISDALDLPLLNLRAVIHGDALSVAVASASIVAKVARDALMVELCERYPGYNFCQNKGYPTPEHKRLLVQRGPCAIHRHSYAPVAQCASQW